MTAAELRVVGRLACAQIRRHPGRLALTLCSTVIAACVVVWVVSGYDALASKFDEFEEAYLGRFDLLVAPGQNPGGSEFGGGGGSLPEGLIQQISQDADVASADPIFQSRARIRSAAAGQDAGGGERGFGFGRGPRPGGESSGGERAAGEDAPRGRGPAEPPAVTPRLIRMGGLARGAVLTGLNSAVPPHPLQAGRWLDFAHPDALEGVITSGAAEQLKVGLGDEVTVSAGLGGENRVRIVGILEQADRLPGPQFRVGLPPSREQALARGPSNSALYVPSDLAASLSGETPRAHFLGIILKKGRSPNAFLQRWTAELEKLSPPAKLQSLAEVQSEITQSTTVESVRAQAYAATGISLLAALFIIFTTLSMGVDERIRQFAMLRAIGLNKSQIGGLLVVESLVLGLLGWGGGLLAGWGLLHASRWWKPDAIQEPAALGVWCILLSGACALGGALIAAVLPAWRAIRIQPLEAMSQRGRPTSPRVPWLLGLSGLALISVNPILTFFVPMPDAQHYAIAAGIGCACMGLGFVLLAPAVILVTERGLAGMLARMLGVQPRLLASQLSSNLWRTAGAVSALTLGLGLFVAMQTWGASMLAPFTPGDWTPDLVAGVLPGGLPDSAVPEVQHIPGVMADECLPAAVEQVKFRDDITGFRDRASASRQDNCVMIGVDPERALGGEHPVFKFRFAAGSRADAIARLKQGRACLVPDHFQREAGLNVGDKFAVIPPGAPDAPLEYEIAGVVNMNGWHWMSKGGLRNRGGGRSAGLMIAPYEQVRQDFQVKQPTFFWMNLDGTKSEEDVQAALLALAREHPAPAAAPRGPGGPGRFGGFGGGRSGPNISIRSREGVRTAIRARASGLIWALCQLPLTTLAVSALGVVNAIASSIRARRWDLGVMRAVGLTRWGLCRLILAESLLVGLAACLLSLGLGVMAGYCGTGITRYVNIRGGLVTPLTIPWNEIGIGFAMTLGLCLLAAVIPALLTASPEPLRLLQAGRPAG